MFLHSKIVELLFIAVFRFLLIEIVPSQHFFHIDAFGFFAGLLGKYEVVVMVVSV